jgi:N-acetylglutamate synthase/N-acetylornithine aminotransferase
VAVDDESVAVTSTGVMAEPEPSDWSPGLVTETVLVTVHENEAESLAPEPSVAVTVTDDVPAVVGVPEMVPEEGSMARPAGRLVADHVSVAVDVESVAVTSTGVMAEPEPSDWSPGLVTETTLVTLHENEAVPVKPELSVAVTVTDDVPAAVGVPEMVPEVGSMARPSGSPVAE